eukprot:12091825-Alexandrium_andersonii.AAC.1
MSTVAWALARPPRKSAALLTDEVALRGNKLRANSSDARFSKFHQAPHWAQARATRRQAGSG